MRRFIWLAQIFLFLTACTAATETAVPTQPSIETAVLSTATVPPPVIVEENAAVAQATAVPEPTQTTIDPTATLVVEAEPMAEEIVAETGVISGRTEEGAFFLGDPNAPITHIDYSDFL